MTARKTYKRKARAKPKKRFAGKAGIARVVNKMLKSKIETKVSTRTVSGFAPVTHNNFITMENAGQFFLTTQGTADPMTGTGQRIGDEITMKGISFKMMLELNARYSDVTARLLVVKCAKGDVPTRANLFAGICGNKMIDKFNTERFTIVAQKYVKLKAPNMGTYGPEVGSLIPPVENYGFNAANDTYQILSRATKIVSMYIPGAKFGRRGLIKYENASTSQLKFFDYHFLVYAYANQSTNQDIVDVMLVNDFVKQIYYTDA